MVLTVTLVCAGCATSPIVPIRKHDPVDPVVLARYADAVLDYVTATSNELSSDIFGAASLSDDTAEAAKEMQKRADAMRSRHAEISKLKARGVLGEDNRGYLSLRNEDRLENAAAKNGVQKVMAAENEDRKALYRGLARASEERGLTLTRVERAFAARRLARAAAGAVVQLPSNEAEFQALGQTPLGKQWPGTVRPGDWVEVP